MRNAGLVSVKSVTLRNGIENLHKYYVLIISPPWHLSWCKSVWHQVWLHGTSSQCCCGLPQRDILPDALKSASSSENVERNKRDLLDCLPYFVNLSSSDFYIYFYATVCQKFGSTGRRPFSFSCFLSISEHDLLFCNSFPLLCCLLDLMKRDKRSELLKASFFTESLLVPISAYFLLVYVHACVCTMRVREIQRKGHCLAVMCSP